MEDELKMPEEIYKQIYSKKYRSSKKSSKKPNFSRLIPILKSKELYLSVLFVTISVFLIVFDAGVITSVINSQELKLIHRNKIIPDELNIYLKQWFERGTTYFGIEFKNIENVIASAYVMSMLPENSFFECSGNLCTTTENCINNVKVPVFSEFEYKTNVYFNNNLIAEYNSKSESTEITYFEVDVPC